MCECRLGTCFGCGALELCPMTKLGAVLEGNLRSSSPPKEVFFDALGLQTPSNKVPLAS